ncbi:hypothetical protein Lal_00044196 [Lupinus albus]|nr:hypothetical protein Lal_00044196 [Lupinus albus]
MKKVIDLLQQANLRKGVKVIVGGGPISAAFADKIGADGYAVNAVEAVKVHVCRPGHKGHDDLTSSSPSSGLSPAVCSGFQTQRWQLNTRVALVAGLNPTPYGTS